MILLSFLDCPTADESDGSEELEEVYLESRKEEGVPEECNGVSSPHLLNGCNVSSVEEGIKVREEVSQGVDDRTKSHDSRQNCVQFHPLTLTLLTGSSADPGEKKGWEPHPLPYLRFRDVQLFQL